MRNGFNNSVEVKKHAMKIYMQQKVCCSSVLTTHFKIPVRFRIFQNLFFTPSLAGATFLTEGI